VESRERAASLGASLCLSQWADWLPTMTSP
jgi:hypothetical protein